MNAISLDAPGLYGARPDSGAIRTDLPGDKFTGQHAESGGLTDLHTDAHHLTRSALRNCVPVRHG